MTVVLGGDFRQILPVIPKGKREHIISASIKRSYLWKNFEEYRLTENMRLNSFEGSPEEKAKTTEFANWILNIGDGTTTTIDDEDWVSIPEDLILHKGDDPKASIVNNTYPELHNKYTDRTYLEERAILCPRNETVDQINTPVMLMRNINQSAGLCNGTRLTITQLGKRFIEGQVITGANIGDKVYIP
uniref:ATP-dependent DNA helicase n=1 Tax=Aegilops tauschii subsp. strangulata TaxID=200361 RepID=A0A453HZ94_AEGTS